VPYYASDKAYNGYTLFTPMRKSVTWLIDMQGCPVHCWELPYPRAVYGVLLPNGNLLSAGTDATGPTARGGGTASMLVEMNWDGSIIWKYEDEHLHHDFCRLDNGNTMVLSHVPLPEDIAAKVQGGRLGSNGEGLKKTDAFKEITPAGEVVWEWLGYEHLDPESSAICPMCPRSGEWTHANSCCVLPNGDILTTFLKITNPCVIIDRKSGDIKWRWGDGELAHSHDPTLLDNGNILIFDNGLHRTTGGWGQYSRVVEVNPKTKEIEWEYKEDPPRRFYSHFISGCQRLPNGNTLICEGANGRLFEVTRDKEIVWEFNNPFHLWRPDAGWNNMVFRAYRYSPDHDALKGKTLHHDRVELTLREKTTR
jgi:hypothetical protein